MNLEYDWNRVARLLLTSRALDSIEENELVPGGEVTYQFSAGGHELAQILLGLSLDHPHDAAAVYYRSRPFMLTIGLSLEEALAGTMAREGSPTCGRDIGVVFNRPSTGGVTVLPMSGDVGTQYTPAAGWAQSIRYRSGQLDEKEWNGAIAIAMGGDGSVATNGFWSALTIATTLRLPMLFFIEDNSYAISVVGDLQTPGGNIAENLASFRNLTVLRADGVDPADAGANIALAISLLREGQGPVLLRLTVPRLPGHSFTDNQAYKSDPVREAERARDPLQTLRAFLVPGRMSEETWQALEREARNDVERARDAVRATAEPEPATACTNVFFNGAPQQQGGLLPEGRLLPPGDETVNAATPVRVNLIDAVRKTIDDEMERNPRIVLFGEDVGAKGGVHGATRGLQSRFGEGRVFDTSLSEEGIVGRAMGMALAGLLPLPEIQFRKYLDPATEQANDIGTIRWRTANRFAAPMVLRMPVGFSKHVGDPWHSVSDESILAHKPGWRIAFPSNAQDAAGLLRSALRGNDPTYFLEHRNLLDTAEARRPYPGDDYAIPFGKAAVVTQGTDLTVVTWGAMVHRCQEAAEAFPGEVEILDLRTIIPWDREAILRSVEKTARCLIVQEDCGTAGFGAEIAATIAQEAFMHLDAPLRRVCGSDCPVPYNRALMDQVVPSVEGIRAAMEDVLSF
jgi:2-oxoisovalerate dehydrogenase E1 component